MHYDTLIRWSKLPFCMQMNMKLAYAVCCFLLLATTAHGARSETARAPSWVEEPSSHVGIQHTQNVLLPCSANGEPRPEVYWLKNGERMNRNQTNANVPPILANNSLFFNGSDPHLANYAGLYQCGAKNLRGTILSRISRVTFWGWNTKNNPQSCTKELTVADSWFEQDSVLVVTCKVNFPWREHVKSFEFKCTNPRRNNNAITRISVMEQLGEMHIRNMNKEDCTTYRCIAHSGLVNDSCPIPFNVSFRVAGQAQAPSTRPFFDLPQREVSVDLGTTVELPCVASAARPTSRVWEFASPASGSRRLPTDDKYARVGNTNNLLVNNVQLSDAGDYTCRASNSFGENQVQYRLTVRSPLRVTVRPSEQTVDLGGSRTLECDYSGSPVDELVWLKDGERVLVARRTSNGDLRADSSYNVSHIRAVNDRPMVIEISNISSTDRGIYQCLVTNTLDSAQASALLLIGAPVFLDEPPPGTNYSKEPGSSVEMRCMVTAMPLPTVTWMLDDVPLVADEHRVVIESRFVFTDTVESIVRLANLTVLDSGEYRCVASNSRNVSSNIRTLNVYGMVEAKPMENVVAVGGKSINLLCRVAGFPIGVVTWFRDRVQLPTDPLRQTVTDRTLRISGVVEADRGVYYCVPHTPEGLAGKNSSVSVSIKYPPLIKQESDRRVKEGDSVTLLCDVNTGVNSIQWLKDGAQLQLKAGYVTTQLQTGSNLAISQAKREFAGSYTCIARNDVGVANMTHALIVEVPSGFAIEPPTEVTMDLGKDRQISCQGSGFPTPTVEWRRYPFALGELPERYVPIEKRDSITSAQLPLPHPIALSNGTLLISEAREDDSGIYLCIVDNKVGPAVSRRTDVVVKIPAQFTEKRVNYSVVTGHSVSLLCRVKGSGVINVSWSHQNSMPRSGIAMSNITIEKGLIAWLNLTSVGRNDGGTYECHANNSGASVTQAHVVVVLDVPEPVRDLKTIGAPGSRSATIAWTAPRDNHSPILNYILQFKLLTDYWSSASVRQLVIPASHTRALIEDLLPASSYSVQVFANNSIGQSPQGLLTDFRTDEEPPSGPPRNVTVSVDSPRSIRVRWLPPAPAHRNGELRGYYVQWKECTDSQWQPHALITKTDNNDDDDTPNEYVIRNLSEMRCYLITVQAFNAKGAGTKSEEIRQLTSEDLPKRPPQGITVRAITATSFSVSWQAPPLDDLGGIPLGYRVFVQQLQDDEHETSVFAMHTAQTEVFVTGLRPYTNYTIRILLYNRVGPSDLSPPIVATTLVARPGRPAAIKLLANPSNITVLWLPPSEPNGIISSYVITLNSPSTSGPPWTLRPTRNAELRQDIPIVWQPGQQYHVTVKAINDALSDGDGDVIDARIGSNSISMPKIANLNRTIRVETGGYVTLPCTVYGSSYVRWIVNLRSQRNTNSGNSAVSEGKADKVLNAVRADDSGTYTCTASNNNDERDMVTYQLEVRDSHDSRVPQAPVLFAEWITESKAMLRWLAPSNGGSRILGYELTVPNQPTQRLSPDARTHLVTRLNCTTQYNIQIRAQNANSIGKPGSITIRTNGSRPIAALEDELRREVNATYVRLALRAFRANGCPITEFDISYASRGDPLRPLDTQPGNTEFYTVNGLQPSAWYEMLIVAKSDGGTAQTKISFQTAAFFNHQKFEPSKFSNGAVMDRQTMSISMITILATVIAVIIFLVAVAAAVFFIKRRTLKKKQKEASTTNLRHNNDSEMAAFIGGTQRQSSTERGDNACTKGGNNQKAIAVRQSSQESAVARCGGSAGRIRRNTSHQLPSGAALTDDEDDIESQKKIAKKRMGKSMSLEKLEKSQKDRPVQKVTKNSTQNKQYAEYAAKAKETRDKLLVNRNSTFDEYGTNKQQSKATTVKQDEKRREQEHAAQLISYCMNDPATANGYAAYASRERGSNTLETESTIDPYAEFPAGHALSSYYQQGGSRTLLQTQHSLQLMQSQTQTCNTAPNGSHTVLLQRGDSFPYACYYPGLQHPAQLHAAPLANSLQSTGATLTYGPAARCAHGYPQNTSMRCVRPSCTTCTSVSATVPFPCCCEMNNNTVGNSTQASVTTTVLPILPPLSENAPSLNDSMMRVQPFYNTIMNGPSRFGSRLIRHHPMSNSMTTVSSTNDELAQAYERAQRAPAQLSALLASEASSTVGPNNSGSDGQCAPNDCPSEATITEATLTDLGIRQFTQMPPCPDEQRQATCEIPYDAQKSRGSLYSTYGIAKRKGATNQQQPLLQQPRQVPLKFVATAPSKLQAGQSQPQRNATRQKRHEEPRKNTNSQHSTSAAQPTGTGSTQTTANSTGVRKEEPIYEDPDEVAANMMRSSYHSQTSQPQGGDAKQTAPHTSPPTDAQFSAFAKFDRTPKAATRADHVLTHVPPIGKNMATVPKVDFVPIRSNSDQPMSPSGDADDDLPPPPPQPQSAPETAGLMSSTAGSSLYGPTSKESTSGPYSSAGGDPDYSAYQYGACPPNLTGALTITRNKDAKLTLARADTSQQSETPANNGFSTNTRRKSSKQKQPAADQSRADSNSHAQVHRGAPASTNANSGTTSQTYYSTIPSLPYATTAEMASGRVEGPSAMQMSSSSAASDRTVRHVPLPQERSTVDDDSKIYSDNIVV